MNHSREGAEGRARYYRHAACLRHDPGEILPGHPDTPARLVALERALEARGWLGWERREAPAAGEQELERVHSRAHVRAIRELCGRGGGAIDADTFVVEASWEAALRAAGAACAMTAELLGGEATVGFCGVRPAGHHAEPARAMGFCLFDNVAVAAADAIAGHGCERVLVLDWDVHAGNGTEAIFRERADVLFACIHEQGLYPGTGPLEDTGRGEGEGFTINLPVPPGSGEGLWLGLLDEIVLPAARAFRPQLVLVSAGYDAHERDPLARCRLRTGSYALLASRVRELGASLGAPVGLVLEGGYDREVLAECVATTLAALTGDAHDGAAEQPDPAARAWIERARAHVGRYWPL